MTECIFGWGKQHGTMRKTKHRGIAAVTADFLLNLIAYNLIRIPTSGCGIGIRSITHHPPHTNRISSHNHEPYRQKDGSISWFFRKLLSCSHSRESAQFFLRRRGQRRSLYAHTAGDRTRRRRLNKLSCAGWVPHDRGSVSGLPRSRIERRSRDRLITGTRISHLGPASRNVRLGF